MLEALIGAVFLHHGFERTRGRGHRCFDEQIRYRGHGARGPQDRAAGVARAPGASARVPAGGRGRAGRTPGVFTSEVWSTVRSAGAGPGTTIKMSEQKAAQEALRVLERPRTRSSVRWPTCSSVRLRGFKTFARPTELTSSRASPSIIGPERQRQEQHRRRRSLGAGRTEPRQPAGPEHAGRHLLRTRRPQVERGSRGEPDLRQRVRLAAARLRPGGDHPAARARQRLGIPA